MIPIGRMGQPEEVTGCAVFLASEDSDHVVAQTYGVGGGNLDGLRSSRFWVLGFELGVTLSHFEKRGASSWRQAGEHLT